MVVHEFPAAKLFVLLIKQISTPISNYIKKQAIEHPIFRNYVCMPPAYFYNWCEVKMKMWMLNLGNPKATPKLNDVMAIDLGSQILGEAMIFFVASSLICIEYSRQAVNEEKKEEMAKMELYRLEKKLQEISHQVKEQRLFIQKLRYTLNENDTSLITDMHNTSPITKLQESKPENEASKKDTKNIKETNKSSNNSSDLMNCERIIFTMP